MLCSDCSHVVKPVVAFDIDGTLGSYHEHFIIFLRLYYGMPFIFSQPYDGSVDFEQYLGLSRAEYREAKLAYRQGGTKRWMPLIEGARATVNKVREAGAEVWIATTRPWQRLDNIDPDTREWLRRSNISYDGLLYGDNKYDQLCEHVEIDRIVAVVDDLPEQIDRARALELPAVQRYDNHNKSGRRSPGFFDYADIEHLILNRIKCWEKRNGNDG